MRFSACGSLVLALCTVSAVMVGCSSEEEAVTPVEDGGAETLGLDVGGGDADATVEDSGVADTGAADSGATDTGVTADTNVADTRPADVGADTRVADAADSATADVGADTRDAATDASAADVADTATDVSDAADARDASDASTDTADTAVSFGTPPACDGVIAAGEYGVHTDGQNQETSDSNTWYMTWNDDNLYVAVSGPAATEGVVLYVEKAPLTPSNGGTPTDGSLEGYTYDSARFMTLPFRADLVVYGKSTYHEDRLANGANGWGMANPFTCYAHVGNVRELAIPWSVIGGRPASMSFLAYAVSNSGFVYAPVPKTLSKGLIGTNATASAYLHVASTAPGSTAKPFADVRTP